MAAQGDGRLTPDVFCLALFPQGEALTAKEKQYLDQAASLGVMTVLCPGDVTPEEAEARYGADMPCAYRIVEGGDAMPALLSLCRREGIPQGGVVLVKDGREERLPDSKRDLSILPHLAWEKLKREIRQRTMDASQLMCVSAGEKRRLLAACKRADKGGRRILIASQMAAFDKGSCDYWKRLQRLVPQDSVLHLSETPALSHAELRQKLDGVYHRARWSAFPAGYPLHVKGRVPEEARAAASLAVRGAAENLSLRFPELGEEGALALSLYLESLFTLALESFRPHVVMMWNAFTAIHIILAAVAKEHHIPVMYMEFGVLPGTMGFDLRGQMGASSLACEGPAAMAQDAMDEAEAVIGYLARRRMNRNAQHVGEPGSAVCLPADGRPVVTFIGQSDYESGICPYDETARREHSPWFASSMEALRALAEVCRKLDCTLVYRPHPSMPVNAADVPQGVVLSRGGDLFSLLEKSDLTVTLMSQVGYEALLHDRNVLMLGRCQLTGKGCAWERGEGEPLADAVSRALRGGYTDEMKLAFRSHVAHVLRDYAYDDLSSRELRYGRQPEKWPELLEEALRTDATN